MSSFFSNMRSGFGRNNNNNNNNKAPQQKAGNGGQSPISFEQAQSSPQLPSPMPSPSIATDQSMSSNMPYRSNPFFFREQYANLIVKGNFMTLAAKPVLIEEGEWLAHQVVEQNRLLDGMLKVIQEVDRSTGQPICSAQSCPSMTSAPGVSFPWYDQNRNPIRVPAPQYISYVQRWIANKVTDIDIFPTALITGQPPALNNQLSIAQTTSANPDNWLGKASGFPAGFAAEIRNIYRHMFRVYSHIYHSHWLEFWHLGAYKELNTCFIHFVNVGRIFGLLSDKDMDTMGPLIDIWLEKGWLPRPNGQLQPVSRVPSRNGSLNAEAGTQPPSGAI